MIFKKELLMGILQTVTVDQVRETIQKYLLPLFDAKTSAAFIVSAPGKADEIKASLEGVGFAVESRTLEVSDEDMEGSESGSDDESDSNTSMKST